MIQIIQIIAISADSYLSPESWSGEDSKTESRCCLTAPSARPFAAHKYAVMELLQPKTSAEGVKYAIKPRIISV
jgi:hypothetical protein